MALTQVETYDGSTESELIQRAVQKDEAAVRAIIQANNRRLYRVARSIVGDDGEAEDVLQESYLRAFSRLANFRGDSSLATWLTRIVLNEALQRLRRRTTPTVADVTQSRGPIAQVLPFPHSGTNPADPERITAQRELCVLLERAVDTLPVDFRSVLVARVIEDMSIEETAEFLGLRPETVKTRLHRARRMLKAALADHIGPLFSDIFPFAGKRCERVMERVVAKLNLTS